MAIFASLRGKTITPSALERLIVVADQAGRYALTTATAQNGDTVKQTDTGEFWYVIDEAQLSGAGGYAVYAAGTATNALACSGNAATVTTNANLTGPVTSVGNATSIANDIALPGSPTTTTQSASDNSTKIATTEYVDAVGSVGSVGSSVGFYLNLAALSDNKTLSATPGSFSQTTFTKATTSANSPFFIERFVSGALGRASIPAAIWTFDTFGSTSNSTGTNEIKYRILRRSAQEDMTGTFTGAGATRTFTVTGGTPFVAGDANADLLLAGLIETQTETAWITGFTSASEVTVTLTDPAFVNTTDVPLLAIHYYLFQDTTGDITGSSAVLYSVPTSEALITGMEVTDRLTVEYFASTSEAGSRNIKLYYGGTRTQSGFTIPTTILHNDMSGLNDGDYNHITDAQLTDLAGKTASQVFTTKQYQLAQTLGADTTAEGITISHTAGENLAFGDIGYYKSDGKVWKADANTAGAFPADVMAIATISADAAGLFLKLGTARNDAWNWTIGGLLYLSITAGTMTQTQPVATDDCIQVLGKCFPNADTISFNPHLMYITHA